MRRGIHGPNYPNWTMADYAIVHIGRFDSVKLMPEHTPLSVITLRGLGVSHFLGRLPNSTRPDDTWKNPTEWYNECIEYMKGMLQVGVFDYVVDNEPNLVWPDKDADTWRWLTESVMHGLRKWASNFPGGQRLRFGLTPLAWKPDTLSYIAPGTIFPIINRMITATNVAFCNISNQNKTGSPAVGTWSNKENAPI